MTQGKVLLVLPLALSTICLDLGCARQHSAESEPARPVKTLPRVVRDKTKLRSFPGKVEAAKKVEMAFQVPGLVVKQPGKEGDAVAKGEIIGISNSSDICTIRDAVTCCASRSIASRTERHMRDNGRAR